jgi:hypothetical protein
MTASHLQLAQDERLAAVDLVVEERDRPHDLGFEHLLRHRVIRDQIGNVVT